MLSTWVYELIKEILELLDENYVKWFLLCMAMYGDLLIQFMHWRTRDYKYFRGSLYEIAPHERRVCASDANFKSVQFMVKLNLEPPDQITL